MSEMLNNQKVSDENETDEIENDSEENEDEAINWQEEAEKWKSKAEKWRSFSRKNENALNALRNETPKASGNAEEELRTLKEALESSKAEIAKYQKQTIVSEILKEYDLPSEASALLTGNTEDELEASAEALKALLGSKAKNPVIPTQGVSSGKPAKVELSIEEETAAYLKARKKQ